MSVGYERGGQQRLVPDAFADPELMQPLPVWERKLMAFRAVDESHLEAARNFGAGTARLTRDVLVPMSAPSLAVGAVLIFSSMLASFSIPLMLSRGGGAQMLMIDVYYRFGQHGDFETASALGVVGYLMAMGAALVYLQRLAPVKRP